VLEAYRKGSSQPPSDQRAASGQAFDDVLVAATMRRLSLTDQVLMRKCSAARDRGLAAARRGRLQIADQACAEARTVAASGALSAEAKLLTNALHSPIEAYVDYRRGEHERACAHLNEAAEADVLLETVHGYKILHLHRIQLVHNLMRLRVRYDGLEAALAVGATLLSYLERTRESLPLPGSWDPAQLDHIPPALVSSSFGISRVMAGL